MPGNIVRIIFGGDSREAEQAADRAGDALGRFGQLGERMQGGMAMAGAGAAAALTAGFISSLDNQAVAAKLQAQMGAGTPAAEQAGRVAGEVYSGAYGESLEQVGNAVRAIMTSGAVSVNATDEEIQGLSANALTLAEVFDQDVTGSINAAAQMVKTGLAPDFESAMDVLTRGFQVGNDKAGDLLDTFNEYSTNFRTLGLRGDQAMGLIRQGLQGGARDADQAADALKEFSIRAIDGSELTAKAFRDLGLDAGEMSATIAKGGPEAAGALDRVLDSLRNIEDPLKRNQIAVALFGTQSEDMAAALGSMDLSNAVDQLGQVEGATQTMNDTLGETASSKIEATKRGFEQWRDSIIGVQGPLGDVAAAVFGMGGDVLNVASQVGILAIALRGLGAGAILSSIAGAASAVLGIGDNADRARTGGVARLGGALRVLGTGAVLAGAILAVDQLGEEARGTADDFMGYGEDVHEFARIIQGDFTELQRAPQDISDEWDQLVGNVQSGKAPIMQVINGISASFRGELAPAIANSDSIWGAMARRMRGDANVAQPAASGIQSSMSAAFNNIIANAQRVRNYISQPIGVNVTFNAITGAISRAIAVIRASIPRFHDGGVMPGRPGSEGLALLKAGETVLPPGVSPAATGGSAMTINFAGNTDAAFASAFMALVRQGKIQVGST